MKSHTAQLVTFGLYMALIVTCIVLALQLCGVAR
jgi:hypothetical protein